MSDELLPTARSWKGMTHDPWYTSDPRDITGVLFTAPPPPIGSEGAGWRVRL